MTTPLPAGSLRATSLNAARRRTELAAVADGAVLDVLVVGGGVVGAGVALDAASRGLSVCLVEARDIGFGTSRWSGNVVHGGLRHLINGDFALARLNAVERNVLMTRTAPHLVHALPTLYPQYQVKLGRSGPTPAEVAVAAGLRAEDALRRLARPPAAVLPPPRHVPTAEALALVPGLRATELRGGTLSFAGQLVDDARLVCALARTAAGFGARVLTRVRATRLHGDGADVVDELTGSAFSVRAHAVVNATGVWANELQESVRLRHWLGTYLVLDAEVVGLAGTALATTAVVAKRPKLVSLTPQQDGLVYLGMADQSVDYRDRPVPETPEPPQSDVDFLLDVGSSMLDRRLRREHVLRAFAGIGARLDTPTRACLLYTG